MATDNEDRPPKITVMKITPQILTLWNKELERLHKALIAPETQPEDRTWIKSQIESLHRMIFDPGADDSSKNNK